uniref:Uncharacterized protein n=1 Tax=Leersia perrieri TaxID=77586 RepID=A0A0D9V199_9ORYZ
MESTLETNLLINTPGETSNSHGNGNAAVSTATTTTPLAMADKVMASTANLAQLLPTGTVLAYQALSTSFTNHGQCYRSNRWLTAGLIAVLAASSVLFSLTDSIVGRSGRLYYGVATPRGLNVFNLSREEEEADQDLPRGRLRELRLRPLDVVHAFFSAVVFLTVAFSDVGLTKCFFPDAGNDTRELLKNLPLGMAFISTFVFLLFPTTRKGIGYTDTTPPTIAENTNPTQF